MFAMTNVGHKGIPAQQHPLAHSWFHKAPPGTTGTMWATDIEYASVDMVAYPSGTLIGQVSGFSYPYGDCSDASGNVWVADFSLEEAFEINSSGSVINSVSTGGESIGCSVSKTGDVAITNFYPGGVKIVAGPDAGASYSGPAYDWPAGYDLNGDLFVECNYASPCSSPRLAELKAGSSSWTMLNFNKSIGFGAAVQEDGKTVGVGDQEPSGQLEFGIYETKVSGSTATAGTTKIFDGSGCSTYLDNSGSWVEVRKNPDGLSKKKSKGYAMATLDCFPGPIFLYGKKGGAPTGTLMPVGYEYDYGVTMTK
jgi:hypothetical protein